MAADEFTRAGERIREQVIALNELRNAGPRDQRFKLWRQNTLTLLQRLWPGEPVRAERFRRIPFSAPPSRSDRDGIREFFARGCKEAASYLNGLASELGAEVVQGGAEMSEQADEPTIGDVAPESEPERAEVPAVRPSISEAPAMREPAMPEPVAEDPPAPRPVEPQRKVISSKPKSEYENLSISFLDRRKVPREDQPAATPAAPVAPPAAPAAPPRMAEAEAHPVPPAYSEPAAHAEPPAHSDASREDPPQHKKTVGMRLKDMLGFSDSPKDKPSEAHEAPPPPAAPPAVPVNVTPLASAPPPVTVVPPSPTSKTTQPAPERRRDLAAEFVLESPVLQSRARPLRRTESQAESEGAPVPPAAAEPPQASAPAPPAATPFVPKAVTPVAPPVVPVLPITPPSVMAPPPAAPAPSIAARFESSTGDEPPTAAQEVYELAVQVDELGVTPQQRAIVRAALIDLGRQMEMPPIHWEALRETVSLAMDHPELARRLMPIVLPYFDQAA